MKHHFFVIFLKTFLSNIEKIWAYHDLYNKTWKI